MKTLLSERLILRTPTLEDHDLLCAFEERNRSHFSPWHSNFLPLNECLKKWVQEEREERACRFFLFSQNTPEYILGAVNFTQIFRGAFQACYLGYKIDHAFEGKGLMKEALKCSIDFVFAELNLHRIMANYMPRNQRSGELLARLGFVKEGFAPRYLLINGQWEDHILTALTNPHWIHHETG